MRGWSGGRISTLPRAAWLGTWPKALACSSSISIFSRDTDIQLDRWTRWHGANSPVLESTWMNSKCTTMSVPRIFWLFLEVIPFFWQLARISKLLRLPTSLSMQSIMRPHNICPAILVHSCPLMDQSREVERFVSSAIRAELPGKE